MTDLLRALHRPWIKPPSRDPVRFTYEVQQNLALRIRIPSRPHILDLETLSHEGAAL